MKKIFLTVFSLAFLVQAILIGGASKAMAAANTSVVVVNTPSGVVNPGDVITYSITATDMVAYTHDVQLFAMWNDPNNVATYVDGSATAGAIVDTVNHKITWNITDESMRNLPQLFSFQLMMNSSSATFGTFKVSVSSEIDSMSSCGGCGIIDRDVTVFMSPEVRNTITYLAPAESITNPNEVLGAEATALPETGANSLVEIFASIAGLGIVGGLILLAVKKFKKA